MRKTPTLFAAVLSLLASSALAVSWQDEISDFDQSRIDRLEQAKAEGLIAAQDGTAAERAAVRAAVEPPSQPMSQGALTGAWRCRQIKLGGLTPAIVYDWFACRIRDTRNGLFFEKVSGTERYSGYLDAYEDGTYVFLGSMTVRNEKQQPYSGSSPAAGAEYNSSDAVGVLSGIGRGHARIEMPYPGLESGFDVIELKR